MYDLLDDDNDIGGGAQFHQQNQQQYKTGWYGSDRRKQQYGYQQQQQQQKSYHQHLPNGYGERTTVKATSSAVTTPAKRVDRSQQQHPHRAWSESDGLDRCGGGSDWLYGTTSCGGFVQQSQNQKQKHRQHPVLMPPPPVPYYCAVEAAAAGFIQYVRKSPSGWWMRKRNRRRRKRIQIKKQRDKRQKKKKTLSRHRSTSAGSSRNSHCTSTTDDGGDDDGGDDDGGVGIHNSGTGSGSNSDGAGDSNSDDQECSDGEFIGALAAAAAIGHDPEREWMFRGSAGDPIAHWDQYDSDSDSFNADARAAADNDIILEWTTEILAGDIRRTQPLENGKYSDKFGFRHGEFLNPILQETNIRLLNTIFSARESNNRCI